MINWYVEVNSNSYNNSDYIKKVIENATPFMNFFCKKISKIDSWKLEDVNRILGDIVNEMPVMNVSFSGEEFTIKYNRYTDIKLVDPVKQIYRDMKISKILE